MSNPLLGKVFAGFNADRGSHSVVATVWLPHHTNDHFHNIYLLACIHPITNMNLIIAWEHITQL